ncbi:Crp/Fnr family transcriptional regulator [Tenacibaculum dicentrarchi]|uniref:Cyclic nucleotide-binding domain-containing protein n=1 Tax=Tenacibaculum finnmarkense genomovar finnmarkense TaxID=1458503 RepID=A0AAP1RHI7_9FLAO|nr:Crp/Fnr family transcriptional regulator [Tenacibaculum finnmarkense]MCD8405299.1 Crp/Fnr family transcriptional regulator [Tenacibaculum dicentrarchi]MBE7653729.1 cyclic nucleotide-binding domain-containing protein [Tenacibaculum finnmarkense genomovar finnmarkense]MBE7696033.1 cyclic nucleotide-binding domain-containing protein [Tenacibaculum finnmarkense genomovar finnmarkense]MCD8406323.1 Crp/Fnr family transcriptional regulator [Tenacibaculum dicentrarchi]MCD8415301.1 Crp/Fnr family tr
MVNIRTYLEKSLLINDSDWQFFTSRLKLRKVKKRTKLLNVGEVENFISFIDKGIVRFFIPRKDQDKDKEITFGFCFSNEFVSAYDSFLTQAPSLYELETLTDVEMWSMSYDDLQKVYQQTSIGNALGRISSERLYLIKSKREQSLLNETAEERYLKLFDERPELIKAIPLKYIASYIGVTAQALSRIRRRIT